jgi:hypothetical protein
LERAGERFAAAGEGMAPPRGLTKRHGSAKRSGIATS